MATVTKTLIIVRLSLNGGRRIGAYFKQYSGMNNCKVKFVLILAIM